MSNKPPYKENQILNMRPSLVPWGGLFELFGINKSY